MIFTPDNFAKDWYGYLTNQLGHTLLGMILAWLFCISVFIVSGELPFRIVAFAVIAVGYFVYEMTVQKWTGVDTIEDTIFVTIYGSGGALMAGKEVVLGSPMVMFDPFALLPIVVIMTLHLCIGCLIRYRNGEAYSNGR